MEYGEAYFHKDEKVYMCTIYFENMECVGVNILDKEEIKDFVANLFWTYVESDLVLYPVSTLIVANIMGVAASLVKDD